MCTEGNQDVPASLSELQNTQLRLVLPSCPSSWEGAKLVLSLEFILTHRGGKGTMSSKSETTGDSWDQSLREGEMDNPENDFLFSVWLVSNF